MVLKLENNPSYLPADETEWGKFRQEKDIAQQNAYNIFNSILKKRYDILSFNDSTLSCGFYIILLDRIFRAINLIYKGTHYTKSFGKAKLRHDRTFFGLLTKNYKKIYS